MNYENPNFNVGLPVFTIHGNHDDPGGTDNLSAVDILATGNLVNYFGKVPITGEGAGKVRIAPVLLQKGETKFALYGLGNIRDERLCRLFSTPHSVEWVRPASEEGIKAEDWFNLFVLHQNRVAHTQAAKNCVREGHLARFLDLVVWGHEHECLAEPWESVEGGGQFSVMQPGSSVATALSEGESKRKHVVMLEVLGQNWRTVKIPLETVRPFVFDTVTLAGRDELDPENPETVSAFLTQKVSSMIEEAVRAKGPRAPDLPLIRLRVDYTGFSTINTQRFGQKFVGKLANPQDIILWQKKAVRRTKEPDAFAEAAAAGGAAIRAGTLDETRIEDLISIHLKQNLEILPEAELTDALRDYIDKGEDKKILVKAVHDALTETQFAAEATEEAAHGRTGQNSTVPTTGADKEVSGAIAAAAEKRRIEAIAAAKRRRQAEEAARAAQQAADAAKHAADGDGASLPGASAPPTQYRDAFDDDSDEGGTMRAPPPKPARGRGRAAATSKKATSTAPTPSNPRKRRAGGVSAAAATAEAVAATPRGRAVSSRSAAASAKKRISSYRDPGDDDRSGDEDVEMDLIDEDDVIEDSEDDQGSDEDLMDEEREMTASAAVPAARRGGGTGRRGRQSNTLGLGTADAPISLIDSDEDEAGGGVTQQQQQRGRRGAQQTTQHGGRSQLTFGRLGTTSQQTSKWGNLK